MLIERLEAFGVSVERQTELLRFDAEDDRVTAHLRGPEDGEDVCEASYIAGCDGARSIVRETIGMGFPGGTYRQVFKDNYASLAAMTWQVHVYGLASGALAGWCADHDVPLQVFDWRSEHDAAGLARDALYLLRPDTYVALVNPTGAAGVIDRYCAERGIRLTSRRLTEPNPPSELQAAALSSPPLRSLADL